MRIEGPLRVVKGPVASPGNIIRRRAPVAENRCAIGVHGKRCYCDRPSYRTGRFSEEMRIYKAVGDV